MFQIPKEYYLEMPQYYNETKFRMHLKAVLSLCTLHQLGQRDFKKDVLIHRLFSNFFKNKDHARLAYDLLSYILDKEEVYNNDIIEKRFIFSLQEAGFFG